MPTYTITGDLVIRHQWDCPCERTPATVDGVRLPVGPYTVIASDRWQAIDQLVGNAKPNGGNAGCIDFEVFTPIEALTIQAKRAAWIAGEPIRV